MQPDLQLFLRGSGVSPDTQLYKVKSSEYSCLSRGPPEVAMLSPPSARSDSPPRGEDTWPPLPSCAARNYREWARLLPPSNTAFGSATPPMQTPRDSGTTCTWPPVPQTRQWASCVRSCRRSGAKMRCWRLSTS